MPFFGGVKGANTMYHMITYLFVTLVCINVLNKQAHSMVLYYITLHYITTFTSQLGFQAT